MSSNLLASQIGQRIFLRGRFYVPLVLDDARPLGSDDSAGFECRVRLPDGSLEEAVISAEEVAAVLEKGPAEAKAETPVDAEKLGHTNREIAAARCFEIPAEAIDQLRIRGGQGEIH